MDATRRDHVGVRAIPDSRILAREQADQCLVLAQGDARQAPGAAIGRAGHAEACARDCRVMGPRIVFEGIEQAGQFREQ
ncbi:MAG: hypothetical protein WCF81_16160, partial [Roseiarcus sp.]